ncbi:multidrug efflux SMR transporter [Catenulispora yoronensis]|uniref:Multidrug efflux SMR transporter n=1 Tax=Catenulispora yoronensis TaxID=450799 RepID=A0ABP5F9D1_9ACTN
MGWLYLTAAIAAEVTGTLALRAGDGFSRVVPSALALVGYCVAFALFAASLKAIPVGAAYSVWSGLGTVGAAVGGLVLFGERPSRMAVAGMAVVLGGVLMIALAGVND